MRSWSDGSVDIAIVFRGDRGLERAISGRRVFAPNCDRLSGRSRIGTRIAQANGGGGQLRSSFGAIEDWNCVKRQITKAWLIAIVFRGDRGLELELLRRLLTYLDYCDRLSGRSRIGTPMHRATHTPFTIAIVFRGDRGLEHPIDEDFGRNLRLRSSFGAIEDWNRRPRAAIP